MSECKVIQVIKTTLLSRGDGEETTYRKITQYWDFEGKLLFEHDPCDENGNAEKKE